VEVGDQNKHFKWDQAHDDPELMSSEKYNWNSGKSKFNEGGRFKYYERARKLVGGWQKTNGFYSKDQLPNNGYGTRLPYHFAARGNMKCANGYNGNYPEGYNGWHYGSWESYNGNRFCGFDYEKCDEDAECDAEYVNQNTFTFGPFPKKIVLGEQEEPGLRVKVSLHDRYKDTWAPFESAAG
jgi:hypothetical protein